MMTCFTRIVVVLSFVRTALATQSMPPNQVLIGLALFLTFFIMVQFLRRLTNVALTAIFTEEISQEEALKPRIKPIKSLWPSIREKKT